MARAGYKFQSVAVGDQRYLSRRGRLAEDKKRDISVPAGLKGEHVLGSTLRGYPVCFLGELGREAGLIMNFIGTVISPYWPSTGLVRSEKVNHIYT